MRLFHQFHRDESGKIAIANMICVMFCVLMIAFTMNNARVVHRRIERQNAADAVAYSATAINVRGMNSITATNHLIGEMVALVSLHEAVGGKKLDNNQRADAGRENRSLRAKRPGRIRRVDDHLLICFGVADGAMNGTGEKGPSRRIRRAIRERSDGRSRIRCEATLLDSKMGLKRSLIHTHYGFCVAAAMIHSKLPVMEQLGRVLAKALKWVEKKIEAEHALLNAIRSVARGLRFQKVALCRVVVPSASQHTRFVRDKTPELARLVASEIAREHGLSAEVIPLSTKLRLPVIEDPVSTATSMWEKPATSGDCPTRSDKRRHLKLAKATQLARATFPWVNYHRESIIDFARRSLFFAGTADLYQYWSTEYCKSTVRNMQSVRVERSARLRRQYPERGRFHSTKDSNWAWPQVRLLVVDGYEGPDKGYEPWMQQSGSKRAEELFGILAISHSEKSKVLGSPVFGQGNPNGSYAWSMALMYNANEQEVPRLRLSPRCNRVSPEHQANIGWDTLNWKPATRSKRPSELVGKKVEDVGYPAIRLNWQAKLVPVTSSALERIRSADLPSRFKDVKQQLPEQISPSLNTH